MSLRALETIERYRMLPPDACVLAAVSGGADSMALLHLLCAIRDSLPPGALKVAAAHVNHGLRGAESDRDEQFVWQACSALKVELFVLHADVAGQAQKTGESIEQAGRRLRYAFFEQKAHGLGVSTRIATAHTLSDSIETTLLNFVRGTGLRGLRGIPAVRGNVIRPLIECTRSDIERYCRENGIRYVQDSSNFSRDYRRNRVRLDIVPQLYRLNPSLDRAALRLKESLERDEDYLSGQAGEALARARLKENSYQIGTLLTLHPALLHRAVLAAACAAAGATQEAVHVEKIISVMRGGRGSVQIKGGLFANARNGELSFTPETGRSDEGFCLPFSPGSIQNGYFDMRVAVLPVNETKNFQNFHKLSYQNALDCDRIRGNLVVRSRKEGDRFAPAGRKVTKSLKKLFNEAKIPVNARSRLPVVADEQGVVWVAGFGADERCAVTPQTKRIYQITINYPEGFSFD